MVETGDRNSAYEIILWPALFFFPLMQVKVHRLSDNISDNIYINQEKISMDFKLEFT